MDFDTILTALGGGVPAVIIAVLGWVVWHLYQRVQTQNDARIADQKEHAAQLMENSRALDRAIAFVKGGTDV